MSESEEHSLGLRDLAETDAPDVVRRAVRRFRRRVAIRTLWVLGAALMAALIIPRTGPNDLPFRFRGAPGEMVGATLGHDHLRVTVIDVRRVDTRSIALHYLATSDIVQRGENLVVSHTEGPLNDAIDANVGGYSYVDQNNAGPTNEGWVQIDANVQRFAIGFFAGVGDNFSAYGQPLGLASGAPMPNASAIAKRNTVFLGNVTFDLQQLGVSETVWR